MDFFREVAAALLAPEIELFIKPKTEFKTNIAFYFPPKANNTITAKIIIVSGIIKYGEVSIPKQSSKETSSNIAHAQTGIDPTKVSF